MGENVAWDDWCAINTALQRYADAFDRADLDAIAALFSPDAIWDHGPGHIRHGRDAIRAFLAERFAVYAGTSHHIGPPAVTPSDDSSTFEAVAYLIATHLLQDGTTYTGYGRYLTTFRATPDGMLIVRHEVVAHVTHGVSAPVNQLARL